MESAARFWIVIYRKLDCSGAALEVKACTADPANMTVSFATFDRLKSKGVAAYKNGDYLAAKAYLVDAAECMLEMAAAEPR